MTDPSAVGEVRRVAVTLAAAEQLTEERRGRVALIATEAATNLLKHASNGEIILRTLSSAEGDGIEILAIDRGPGIADLARCMRDGFSTTGTAGAGLGAISRLSDFFEITSHLGSGTALVAHVRTGSVNAPVLPARAEIGAVCLPMAGEEVSGDSWAVELSPEQTAILVVDGLGHGLAAATAAREAVRVFRQQFRSAPAEIIQSLHNALRPTRGGAAAVAIIDHATRALRYAGVGNIAGAVVALGRRQGLVSHSGIIGHTMRRVQTFEYAWPPGSLLVMHSDGLGTQWDLSRYPGLTTRHSTLVASVLYRDFRRGQDDVTVLVTRDGQGGST